MIQILAKGAQQLQNVYTPLPLSAHFVFCLIATLLYLVQFCRKGSYHYLLLMFAVDATICTQFWTSPTAISALGLCEVALLAAAAVLSFRYSKAMKKLNAEKLAEQDSEEKKAKSVQKAESEKDDKLVDNAFDDE